MNEENELDVLRERIAEVTLEILRLCGERFSLAKKIGEIKIRMKMPIENTEVEDKLKRKVLEECRVYGIDSHFGLKVLNLLLEESRRIQRSLFEEAQT